MLYVKITVDMISPRVECLGMFFGDSLIYFSSNDEIMTSRLRAFILQSKELSCVNTLQAIISFGMSNVSQDRSGIISWYSWRGKIIGSVLKFCCALRLDTEVAYPFHVYVGP